jgi:hypothetical protein
MLKEISLKNFKIFEGASFKLGRVTVLVGPGASGKSSVLDALSVLAQSGGREGLMLDGPRVKGVHYEDIVHKHQERRVIEFAIKLEFGWPVPGVSDAPSHTVDYMIAFDKDGFREQRATFSFGGGTPPLEFLTPRIGKEVLPSPLRGKTGAVVTFDRSTYTLLPFRFAIRGQDPSLHRGVDWLSSELLGFLVGLVHIVPSQRVVAENDYPEQALGGKGVWQSAGEMVNELAYRWDIRDKVSDWLSLVAQRRIGFVKADGAIRVQAASTGAPWPITCESDGVRQLVWPLAALARAGPGSLVAIEEPEIHLHPQAQAKFAGLMVELATKEGKRILLTTHSEHIVMAFLTAVANRELPLDNFSLYYLREEEGRSVIQKLAVDEKGAVDGGLPGFFEATLDELEGYLEALSQGDAKADGEA